MFGFVPELGRGAGQTDRRTDGQKGAIYNATVGCVMLIDADREWKGKRRDGDLLDDHDGGEADGLYEGKDVDSTSLDVT